MKIRILFVLINLMVICSSCEKEEWEKDSDGFREYLDKFSPSTWVYVSDKDSIRMNLGYWMDTTYSSSILINEFDISNGIPVERNYEFYSYGYVYNNVLKMEYEYENKEKKYTFTLNNDKLTLNNFRNNQNYTFDKEYETKEYLNDSILYGEWNTIMNKDSVTMVFENGMKKEYVYEKNTGKILKYTVYDAYSLRRNIYTLRSKKRNEDKIWLYDKSQIVDISRYQLNGNRIIMYKNGNQIVYTKQ